MNPNHEPSPTPFNGEELATDDRRSREREDIQASLKLTLDTSELSGITENISGVGVLFFTEGSLKVTVEVEEDGKRLVRKGRLVRVQRMSLENTGLAVEFDPE